MKFTIVINFRPFNDPEERKDAGYFGGFDSKNRGQIEVNTNDSFLEQMLTLYHELTHAIFEIVTAYEKRGKKWIKRTPDVQENWKATQYELEETTCMKVEDAVQNSLKSSIVSDLFAKLFGSK